MSCRQGGPGQLASACWCRRQARTDRCLPVLAGREAQATGGPSFVLSPVCPWHPDCLSVPLPFQNPRSSDASLPKLLSSSSRPPPPPTSTAEQGPCRKGPARSSLGRGPNATPAHKHTRGRGTAHWTGPGSGGGASGSVPGLSGVPGVGVPLPAPGLRAQFQFSV